MDLMRESHQFTVDAYAVQHPGGVHPDKSIDIHLVTLMLGLEGEIDLSAIRQRMADAVAEWPHFIPPATLGPVTVLDVAAVAGSAEHAATSASWAESVWAAWSEQHDAIRRWAGSI